MQHPLAEKTFFWSGYNYVLGNPVRLVDPFGLSAEEKDAGYYRRKAAFDAWQGERDAEYGASFLPPSDYIYDQQEDGSYKRREGVENDGGEIFHTYHHNDGTTSYYNQREKTFATIDQKKINESVEKNLNETVVHQIGLTASGGSPAGLTVNAGIAWDSKGNVNPYGSIGFFHGLEITAGVEYTQSRSNTKDPNFSINSLKGTSVNYNVGYLIIDAAYGGDTQGNGNYGQEKNHPINLTLGVFH